MASGCSLKFLGLVLSIAFSPLIANALAVPLSEIADTATTTNGIVPPRYPPASHPTSISNLKTPFLNLTSPNPTLPSIPTAVESRASGIDKSTIPAGSATTPVEISNESPQALALEKSKTSDGISPAKRTDGPINPNIFYRTTSDVHCPTVNQLRAMDDDPSNYPMLTFRVRGGPMERPHFSAEDGVARSVVLNRAWLWLAKCRACECDPQTGRIRAPPRTASTRVAVAGSRHCLNEYPRMCELWIGCYCVFEMQQPPRFREVTVEDYQDALDKVPDHLKNANPDYVWKPSPGWEMTWSNGGGGSSGTARGNGQPFVKMFAPGPDGEMHYLEGPGSYNPRMRDWSNNYAGDLGGIVGGGSPFVKRE
ncbi:hypothetical protein TWF481_001010 [Arthrobotrys musiformis]|uniref:Uncharacterized protein n=1 Tax=Arthrobotrys musiformis TaxID=47236 RepID=A0AAV9WP99_9PEZI